MSSLSRLDCRPCRKGEAPLDADAARALAREIPDWQLDERGTRIERRFAFADFAGAYAFVAKVAEIAEAANHHPDISFGWGYATLSLQTHAIGGLHQNDFIIAARCDESA